MREGKLLSIYPFIYNMAFPVMILTAFVVAGFFISGVAEVDILNAYTLLFAGAFGSPHAISEVLVKTSPILLTAIAAAFALKCGFVNVGVEGQMMMGALATAGLGLVVTGSPFIGIPLVIFVSFLIGASWGTIAAFIKIRFRVSEIITTIMMNFIALYLAQALIIGPWSGTSPEATGLVMTDFLESSIYLPKIIPGTRTHAGTLIGIISTILLYLIVRKTVFGYKVQTVGSNPKAARYAGFNLTRNIIFALMISGGIAGFAGAGEIAGLHHFMRPDFSQGFGFMGLTIAYVAKGNIPLTALGSFLFGSLIVGTASMRYGISVIPPPVVPMLLGLMLISIIIADVIRKKTRERR